MRPWLTALPMRELVDRYCYYETEPFGWETQNALHGQLCATIATSQGMRCKPADFYLTTEEPPPADPADIAAFFRALG